MSADFLRKLLNKLDNLSQITTTFCGALLAYAGGNLRTHEMGIFQQRNSEMPIVSEKRSYVIVVLYKSTLTVSLEFCLFPSVVSFFLFLSFLSFFPP